MGTKEEIRSKIDSDLSDNQNIPISTLRGLLKDDSINILDTIYGDVQTDTHLTQTFLQLVNENSCSFECQYVKQGRKVLVTGKIYDIQSTASQFANINISALYPKIFLVETGMPYPYAYSVAYTILADNSEEAQSFTLRYNATGGTIYVKPTLQPGKTVYFSLIYDTQN